MSETEMVMYLGFLLATYAVVGNDAIQTLGTFLSSNQHTHWGLLTIYAGTILTVVLIYGWQINNGDVSYGRLLGDGGLLNPRYKEPSNIPNFDWYYLLPPLILLIITRLGIPVSTTFLILTFFNPKNLYDLVIKSMSGYLVAFSVAIILYLIVIGALEKKWISNKLTKTGKKIWISIQWTSTGLLWSQWLIQDFANIYVYLPRTLDITSLFISIAIFWILLGYIFYFKGGAIQSIVLAKTNTQDIRSATLIDCTFAIILFFFKELNNIPMSTTWVFLGLLAGREIGIKYFVNKKIQTDTLQDLGRDLGKLLFGISVSIVLVFLLRWIV